MLAGSVPVKFPIPWANSITGAPYLRNIPQASQIGITNGAASLTDGFPPNCFDPIAAGGSWPWAQDFNGILKLITQWNQWQQAGAPVNYDATFQTAIGGYPKGAVVQSIANFGVFWLSTADNNVTNPDAGGAGWVTQLRGFSTPVVYAAPGTFTFVVPGRVLSVWIAKAYGGGGGGGGSDGVGGVGSGGGGGGEFEGVYAVTPGASITIVVGTPGYPGAGTGGLSNGGAGGTTSFGAFASATGGGGGAAGNSAFGLTAGAPGTATGGMINRSGMSGALGYALGGGVYVAGQGGAAFGGPAQIEVGQIALTGQSASFTGTGGGGGLQGGPGGSGGPGFMELWY